MTSCLYFEVNYSFKIGGVLSILKYLSAESSATQCDAIKNQNVILNSDELAFWQDRFQTLLAYVLCSECVSTFLH